MPMTNYSQVYTYSDQPTTCPICGSRSEVTVDFSHTKDKTEVHQCPSASCKYEFVMVADEDIK